MQVKNQRIVITGGTSGIGYELVKQLHTNNEIMVISRNAKKLEQLSTEFKNVRVYQADLSNIIETERIAEQILDNYQSIDMLINNAASQYTPRFVDNDFDHQAISKEITLNFTSVCCMSYLLLPALLHEYRALILNINSGLALAPKTSSAVYCATKAAMNVFTQSLRYQLEHTNIAVQQAFLELVDTSMTEGRGANKMSTQTAVMHIIDGVKKQVADHDIGKVKLLRLLLRLLPSLAKNIMKKY